MLENLQKIKQMHFQNVDFEAFATFVNSNVFFSQFDMALVQSAFFAGIITFPNIYGLQNKPR